MAETVPVHAPAAATAASPASTVSPTESRAAAAGAPAAPDDGPKRRRRRATAGAPWSAWLLFFAATGTGAGILWWLLAPGGAFYGDGSDFKVWLPRDATLALLLTVAGVLSAVLALRGPGRLWTVEKPSLPLYFGLLLGGLAASVLAWRIGVFAGDLFRTPPADMANPSMVFSLRSPTVLMLWPLCTSLIVFASKLIAYSFLPEPKAEPLHGRDVLHG